MFVWSFQHSSQAHTLKVANVPPCLLLEPPLASAASTGTAISDWFFESFEEVSDEDMDFPFSWLFRGNLQKPRGDPQLERDDGALGDIRRLAQSQCDVGVHDSLKVALAATLILAVHYSGKHRRVSWTGY